MYGLVNINISVKCMMFEVRALAFPLEMSGESLISHVRIQFVIKLASI